MDRNHISDSSPRFPVEIDPGGAVAGDSGPGDVRWGFYSLHHSSSLLQVSQREATVLFPAALSLGPSASLPNSRTRLDPSLSFVYSLHPVHPSEVVSLLNSSRYLIRGCPLFLLGP